MRYGKTSFIILLLLYAASACDPNPRADSEPSLEEQVRALEVELNREAKANAPAVERPIRSSFTEGFEPWERWPADRNHSFDLAPIMLYIGSDPEMDSLLDIR